jgi:thiol-disulfide isomerase/thioredoxin
VGNAPELVREVRAAESWIDHVDSFHVKLARHWHKPPEGIAHREAELRKQFPDIEPTEERFPELRADAHDTVEIAFDKTRLYQCNRGGPGDVVLDERFWDGKRLYAHEKYTRQEHYAFNNEPWKSLGRFLLSPMSWLRAGLHEYWWEPKAGRLDERFFGAADEFRMTGREVSHDVDCWTLECDKRSQKWHVGVQDHRLYRMSQHSIDHCLTDYREVAPGRWMPMAQSYTLFIDKGEFISSETHLKVVDVRINEPLPESMFHMELVDGVQVHDWGHQPPLHYNYKKHFEPTEWEAILAKAVENAKVNDEHEHAGDVLIGKPAPEFPRTQWLNSAPLALADLKGKVVVLDFFSEWCGPCRNDLPTLADLHKDAKNSGLMVIGIHTAGSEQMKIDALIKQYELNYPICIDAADQTNSAWGELMKAYRIVGIPKAYVIDADGNVAAHGSVGNAIGRARRLVK